MADHATIDHTGVTGVLNATNPNPTTIELGHASDTTLARVSAGVVSIEGTNIVKAGAVTTSGLTQTTARLLGRTTAATGAIEEITVGSGLSLSAGSLTATGGSGVSYCNVSVLRDLANANQVFALNSVTYVEAAYAQFYHDWDFFPATHFQIGCFGQANEAAQTVKIQLAAGGAPTTPYSAAGDDVTVTNTLGNFSSGWVAVNGTPTGLTLMCLAFKGSNTTVDFSVRWLNILFKIV